MFQRWSHIYHALLTHPTVFLPFPVLFQAVFLSCPGSCCLAPMLELFQLPVRGQGARVNDCTSAGGAPWFLHSSLTGCLCPFQPLPTFAVSMLLEALLCPSSRILKLLTFYWSLSVLPIRSYLSQTGLVSD